MTGKQNNDSLFEDTDHNLEQRHVDSGAGSNDSLFGDSAEGTTTGTTEDKEDTDYKHEKQKQLNAIAGTLLGAQVAGSVETGKKVLPVLQTMYNRFAGQPTSDVNLHRVQSNASLQRYLNSQVPNDIRISLEELGKISGKPIRTMSEVQDALSNIKSTPRTPRTTSINPVTGMPRQVFTAPKPQVDLSAYRFTPNMITKAADELAHAGDLARGVLPSLGRIGIGGVGGGLAGAQLYDAVNQYNKEGQGLHMPSPRNAAQFASGVGGALSTLPFGVTQGVGMALQAPELAYQGYEGLKELNERRKKATREDVNRMLTEVDPMGNPL